MRKINVKEVFIRLSGFEYELLKYIYRTQGESPAPVNFYEAATALSAEKDAVRRGLKRLVDAKILLVDGEKFRIDEVVLKNE